MSDRQVFLSIVGGGLAALFLVCGGCCLVPSVEPGHVGVVKTFGDLNNTPFPAGGPYLVKPWSSVIRVNVQTQKNDEELSISMKGGLSVQMHAVLLYKVKAESVAGLLKEANGGKYEEVFVDPTFKSCVRDVCGNHPPEDLYDGTSRTAIEAQILARVQKELEPRGFVCDSVLIQDPNLPQVVKDRIQAKFSAEQDVIRMESVLKQKKLEADGKVVEAEGIAKAQAIIQKDLSQEYLVYQHILALKEAAQHGNAIIYVPVGPDGLPLVGAVKGAKK